MRNISQEDAVGKHIKDIIGDEVIACFAQILRQQRRKSDVICRFGGEEFIMLLPETDTDGAYSVADSIRLQASQTVLTLSGEVISYSVSSGIAAIMLDDDQSVEQAIHRADSALYRAKEQGKNRCELGL